ncbi:Cytochrome b5, putative [Perkinsus marinus ATCC 50983]|uniref:Cytochrome b5, putative n=1 Tax=Perkinsus marinus (strain ATCC 50983 / TXsc) TaxID=423536 RepID=C5KVG6_PERM5|nr:Cytochrome b5, putative [Perkinsus marinus ATCC 50983]EER11527.1 Cytochrome b5, putative [Perkinsus marinus ATCC 50983]|eukprot:XP_002779732.1 Cytochrome b5, putative [Perkinsus marinus ATCC 50983]
MPRVVTALELRDHREKDNCWMAILGKVYDITEFLSEHPGGSAILLRNAGKDATKEFEKFHSEDMIERVMPDSALVGVFEEIVDTTSSTAEEEVPVERSISDSEATLDMMLNAMDFKAVAEKKVSAEGWAYLYSAAGDEFSYAENEDAFSR